MNIYLDIDGVLLTKDGKAAPHVQEFLEKMSEKHQLYWLTTHCKGNSDNAILQLFQKVPAEALAVVQEIRATNWRTWKTEAIDWTQDFIWLDDYIFIAEQMALEEQNAVEKFIKVDLENNPNQLKEIYEQIGSV